MSDPRSRIRAQIEARKAAGTYVSEAEVQAEWERKVAATCREVTSRCEAHALVERLATSVERAHVVKRLRDRAAYWRGVPLFGFAVRVLLEEVDAIEKGEHLK